MSSIPAGRGHHPAAGDVAVLRLKDDVELMTKEEVLNFKPTPRLEQIGDIHSEQMDDRKSSFRMMR